MTARALKSRGGGRDELRGRGSRNAEQGSRGLERKLRERAKWLTTTLPTRMWGSTTRPKVVGELKGLLAEAAPRPQEVRGREEEVVGASRGL